MRLLPRRERQTQLADVLAELLLVALTHVPAVAAVDRAEGERAALHVHAAENKSVEVVGAQVSETVRLVLLGGTHERLDLDAEIRQVGRIGRRHDAARGTHHPS